MMASTGVPQAIEFETDSFLSLDLDHFGIVDENLDRTISDAVERGPNGLLDCRNILPIACSVLSISLDF